MIDLDTIENIVNDYKIKYMITDGKGFISYEHKFIGINPVYNEDTETLAHEITHHYHDNVLGKYLDEQQTETYAMRMLEDPIIKDYLASVKIDNHYLNCSYNGLPLINRGCDRK